MPSLLVRDRPPRIPVVMDAGDSGIGRLFGTTVS